MVITCIDLNFNMVKTCSKCKQDKPAEDFNKRRTECKECQKERQKAYRKQNPEKIKESRKAYRKQNAEKIKEYNKAYRKQNRQRTKKYDIVCRNNNEDPKNFKMFDQKSLLEHGLKGCPNCKKVKIESEVSVNNKHCKECYREIYKKHYCNRKKYEPAKESKCKQCQQVKLQNCFRKDNKRKSGLSAICKDCVPPRPPSLRILRITEADKLFSENLKKCIKCKKIKNIEDFHKNKNTRYGLNIECKECNKQKRKKWCKENKDYASRWEENKKLKAAQDPVYALGMRIRGLIYETFTRKNFKKCEKTEKILGCSIQQFFDHLESQFEPWMNWDNRGNGWHVDHIIPIAVAKTEDDVIRLNHYTNLQPLSAYDNLSKGAKLNWNKP